MTRTENFPILVQARARAAEAKLPAFPPAERVTINKEAREQFLALFDSVTVGSGAMVHLRMDLADHAESKAVFCHELSQLVQSWAKSAVDFTAFVRVVHLQDNRQVPAEDWMDTWTSRQVENGEPVGVELVLELPWEGHPIYRAAKTLDVARKCGEHARELMQAFPRAASDFVDADAASRFFDQFGDVCFSEQDGRLELVLDVSQVKKWTGARSGADLVIAALDEPAREWAQGIGMTAEVVRHRVPVGKTMDMSETSYHEYTMSGMDYLDTGGVSIRLRIPE